MWAVKHFRHYIYGHSCTVVTDHEVLKSLLNTPHPSRKLAWWEMALQELDLDIQYRLGKANARVDALPRHPIPPVSSDSRGTLVPEVIAAIEHPVVVAQSGESTPDESLGQRQRSDPQLERMIRCLENGELPADKEIAKETVLSHSAYTLLGGVLYHLAEDKTLRTVPSASDRHKLFLEIHEGAFSGHLWQAKIHSQLSRHYWWLGMCKDLDTW